MDRSYYSLCSTFVAQFRTHSEYILYLLLSSYC
uniref:Uncharacterized protein n=1 Tax=Anguilla anguilla TaxID=7936 RepID=A0A0E9VWW0_ANGAN